MIETKIYIACDTPGCSTTYGSRSGITETLGEELGRRIIERNAKKIGWQIKGNEHVCPLCVDKFRKTKKYLKTTSEIKNT